MIKDRQVKIYCYTNKINGKKYIGQTCESLANRAGRGGKRYASSTKFFNAILQYGWINFEPEILEMTTKEFADEREKFWIKQFKTVENGYNLSYGGKIGHSFSKETRERVKKSMEQYGSWFKGKCHNEQTRLIMSEKTKKWISEKGHPLKGRVGELSTMWGKHHSEETKNKLSEQRRGEKNPMFGVTSPFKGKHHTEISKNKAKLSKSNIVYLTSITNGERFAFIGAKDASIFANISKGRIHQCAKINGVTNGYVVSYGGKYKDNQDVKIFTIA